MALSPLLPSSRRTRVLVAVLALLTLLSVGLLAGGLASRQASAPPASTAVADEARMQGYKVQAELVSGAIVDVTGPDVAFSTSVEMKMKPKGLEMPVVTRGGGGGTKGVADFHLNEHGAVAQLSGPFYVSPESGAQVKIRAFRYVFSGTLANSDTAVTFVADVKLGDRIYQAWKKSGAKVVVPLELDAETNSYRASPAFAGGAVQLEGNALILAGAILLGLTVATGVGAWIVSRRAHRTGRYSLAGGR